MNDKDGYRPRPEGGPSLRTDIVEVYVFREDPLEFLQLLRAGEPLRDTWHPIIAHIERGETAARCAVRELGEEIGLAPDSPDLLGMWALEQVHPFYVNALDTIVLSPRFAAHVSRGFKPVLSPENTGARWIPGDAAPDAFMWPGQAAACREVFQTILRPDSPARDALRIDPRSA